MYESRLRKRKVKEEVPQEEVHEKTTKKRVRTATKQSRYFKSKEDKKVELEVVSSEPDLDLTKTCPNEVCSLLVREKKPS